ncbi:MAG: glutamate carboxypeptidase [Burkholderiaceae bacterium]
MSKWLNARGGVGLSVAACIIALGISTSSYARDDTLFAAAKAERQPTLDTLKELVSFDSGTLNGDGVKKVADIAEGRLKAMGFATERVDAKPSVGVKLVGRIAGKGTRKLLLLAHMDTVYLDGTAARQPFHIDGNKAYGAGIGDDKAGIAVVLHATRLMLASGFDDFARITVLFNADEERGSPGSRELIKTLAAESDAVLSFEGTGIDQETIRTGTSGITRVTVTITGKASHAGVAPERGVNALVEAADLVLRTQDLDDPKGVRFNWTVERAGEVANVIPDHATVQADVRYRRDEDLKATLAKLDERVAKKRLQDAVLKVDVLSGRPGMVPTAGSRRVVALAQAIYGEIGLKLAESEGTGGATDAAYAAQTNQAVVESMGLPSFGAHSNSDEYVLVDRIPARLYLAVELMKRVLADRAPSL